MTEFYYSFWMSEHLLFPPIKLSVLLIIIFPRSQKSSTEPHQIVPPDASDYDRECDSYCEEEHRVCDYLVCFVVNGIVNVLGFFEVELNCFEVELDFFKVRVTTPNDCMRTQQQQIPEIDAVSFVAVCRSDGMRVDEVDISAEYRKTTQQRKDNHNAEIHE
jgi:hypothetical protein